MPCANRSRSILNLVFPSCLTVHPCEGVINQMASKEHGDAAKYTEALAVVRLRLVVPQLSGHGMRVCMDIVQLCRSVSCLL